MTWLGRGQVKADCDDFPELNGILILIRVGGGDSDTCVHPFYSWIMVINNFRRSYLLVVVVLGKNAVNLLGFSIYIYRGAIHKIHCVTNTLQEMIYVR